MPPKAYKVKYTNGEAMFVWPALTARQRGPNCSPNLGIKPSVSTQVLAFDWIFSKWPHDGSSDPLYNRSIGLLGKE